MKKKLTGLLAAMALSLCAFAAAGFTAFAEEATDGSQYTTTIDFTNADAKKDFAANVTPDGADTVFKADASEIWDFDAAKGTATSKTDLMNGDVVWSNFALLIYDKAEYQNFELEVTLKHVGTKAGWTGLFFGMEDPSKSIKDGLANPKGGMFFLQGDGNPTWHDTAINNNEWNQLTPDSTFNGLADNVHHLKVYKNNIIYTVNGTERFRLTAADNVTDTALPFGKLGIMVSNKTVEVSSMKITSLTAAGTPGLTESNYDPVTDITVTGLTETAVAGTPVAVTASVIPATANPNFSVSFDRRGAVYAEGKILFKEAGNYKVTFASRSDSSIKKEFTVNVSAPERTGTIEYPLTESGMDKFETVFVPSTDGGTVVDWKDYYSLSNGELTRTPGSETEVSSNYAYLYFKNRSLTNFEITFRARSTGKNGWFGIAYDMNDKTAAGNQKAETLFMQTSAKKATAWGKKIGGPGGMEFDVPTFAFNEYSTYKFRVFGSDAKQTVEMYVDDMVNPVISGTDVPASAGPAALFASVCEVTFKDVSLAVLDASGNVIPYKAVESVAIGNKKTDGRVGESFNLNATLLPADASYGEILFESDNSNVATVNDEGKVTLLMPGTAVLKAYSKEDPSKSDSFTVTVSKPDIAVTGITIHNKRAEAKVGDASFTLSVTVNPSGATNRAYTFSVSDEKVATVSETGVVTIVGAGEVTITVTSAADPSKADSFTMKVADPKSGCGSVGFTAVGGTAGVLLLAGAACLAAGKRGETR